MPTTDEQVFEKIQTVLEEALGVDDDEVTPDARLEADLGAESIDYLDINFRLEKAFGIKIEQSELFPEAILKDPANVENGRVTDRGLTALKDKLPYADFAELEKTRQIEDFRDAFTVGMLVRFVRGKMEE